MVEKNLQVLSYAQMGERQIPIYGSVEEPLFKAKDVADVLEMTNVTDMISRVDEEERSKFNLGRQGETWFLTEAGLYEVFFQSRKPVAKEFKKVVKAILHTLRTKGEVSVKPSVPIKRKPAFSKTRVEGFDAYMTMIANRFSLDAVSQQRMVNQFAKENDLPLLDYTPSNGGRDSITNLLKAHGIEMSARQANKILSDNGFLVQRTVTHKNGKVSSYYEVTEKGKTYGDNFQSEHNPKTTQPLWYTNKFDSLMPLF